MILSYVNNIPFLITLIKSHFTFLGSKEAEETMNLTTFGFINNLVIHLKVLHYRSYVLHILLIYSIEILSKLNRK